MPQLFRIFASRSPKARQLNNVGRKELFLQMDKKWQKRVRANRIIRIIGFYFSVLAHRWTIILEMPSVHHLDALCRKARLSRFNTIKTVPPTAGRPLKRSEASSLAPFFYQ